jgi:hypothetical protein
MQHNKYNDIKTWHPKTSVPGIRDIQVAMIKKMYPDYTLDKWVLWIITDYFQGDKPEHVIGNIEILKKSGEVIHTEHVARNPYPNKKIFQMSMKSGRKRAYGIPLVFDTFEELAEVEQVNIEWHIYCYTVFKGNKEPYEVKFTSLSVGYDLSFEKDLEHSDYHFFTVFSYDFAKEFFEKDAKKVIEGKNYYDQFDIALFGDGTIYYNLECIIHDDTIYEIKESLPKELAQKELEVIKQLHSTKPSSEILIALLEKSIICEEIQWRFHSYWREETLTACYMADLLPETSFGFPEPRN